MNFGSLPLPLDFHASLHQRPGVGQHVEKLPIGKGLLQKIQRASFDDMHRR